MVRGTVVERELEEESRIFCWSSPYCQADHCLFVFLSKSIDWIDHCITDLAEVSLAEHTLGSIQLATHEQPRYQSLVFV